MAEAALSDIRVLDLAGEIGVYAHEAPRRPRRRRHPHRAAGRRSAAQRRPVLARRAAADRSLYVLQPQHEQAQHHARHREAATAAPSSRSWSPRADIVVETFEPGYLDSLGLGYDGLATIRPDIILTSITGFGQDGPHAHYRWSRHRRRGDERHDDARRREARIRRTCPYGNQGYIGAGIQAAARDDDGARSSRQHRRRAARRRVDAGGALHRPGDGDDDLRHERSDVARAPAPAASSRSTSPASACTNARTASIFAYLGTPGGAPWTVMLDWMNSEGTR